MKTSIYLLPPARVEINTNGEDLVMILRKNLYGLKDAGMTWCNIYTKTLRDLGSKNATLINVYGEKKE